MKKIHRISICIQNNPYEDVCKALNRHGIYRPELLYAGMNAEGIPELLRTGSLENRIIGWDTTYLSNMAIVQKIKSKNPDAKAQEYIYAGTAENIKNTGNTPIDPWQIATRYPLPAIAVYDADKLRPADHRLGQPIDDGLKKFYAPEKRLEAVVAVLIISYEEPKTIFNCFGLLKKKAA